MTFYDKIISDKVYPSRGITEDMKQTVLLRSLNSYFKKHGTSDGFEDYCRSKDGTKYLKSVAKYTRIDTFNERNMKKRNRNHSLMNPNEMAPVSMNEESTKLQIAKMSEGRETNIDRAQYQMEAEDQIQKLYASANDQKKKAMELMVEALEFKDAGKRVPKRVLNSLQYLRAEIQKSDPTWKLDLALL